MRPFSITRRLRSILKIIAIATFGVWTVEPCLSADRERQTNNTPDIVCIGDDRVAFIFDRENGLLKGIRNARTARSIALSHDRDLFKIMYRPQAAAPDVALSAQAFVLQSVSNGNSAIVLELAHVDSGIKMTCRVAADRFRPGVWGWTAEVDNAGTGFVSSLTFPIISGISEVQSTRIPESLWGHPQDTGEGLFPGDMSMGFVFARRKDIGLYLASLDRSFSVVHLSARTEGDATGFSAECFRSIPPHRKELFEYEFAVGEPDIYWACDLYRAWTESWMKQPVWPEWARHADGWFSSYADTEAALLDRRETTIFEIARWYGLPYLQLWVGLGDGEFCGRMPYLNPRLGTPEMSMKDSERIRARGGHIGHYVQAQEWDASFGESGHDIGFTPQRYFPPDLEVESREWADRWTLNGPAGFKGAGVRHMCVATAAWQDHIARHVSDRVRLFGNDAVYIDQLGCSFQKCSDVSHEHGPCAIPSGPGFVRLAGKAISSMRADNPDSTVAQEGMSAATRESVFWHLASSRPFVDHGEEFLYTFPDLAVLRGSGNSVFVYNQLPLRRFLRDLYLFHRFELPKLDPYARDLILLRQRVRDWQYDGRFMAERGLTALAKGVDSHWGTRGNSKQYVPDMNRVRAKWFLHERAGAQGLLINWHNADKVSSSRLTLDRSLVPFTPADRAFVFFDDGAIAPVDFRTATKELVFDVPDREVGSILLPGPVDVKEAFRVCAWQSMTAGPDRLVLAVLNIGTNSMKLDWCVNAPGFELESTSGRIDLASLSTARVEIPILNLCKVGVMEEAVVTWTHGRLKRTCMAVLSPPLRNGDMERDENGDGTPDSFWNSSVGFCHSLVRFAPEADLASLPAVSDRTVRCKGRASLRVPGPVEHEIVTERNGVQLRRKELWRGSADQPLFLKPSTRYRMSCMAFRSDPKAGLAVEVTPGGGRAEASGETNAWIPIALEFATAADPEQMLIRFVNTSASNTPVWVDDVDLEELPAGSP